MADHREPRDRNRAPDTIPADIVDQFEAEARATIAAADGEAAGRRRLAEIRGRVLDVGAGKVMFVLATIALFSLILWLTVAPESVALFIFASASMLCATLGGGWLVWRTLAGRS